MKFSFRWIAAIALLLLTLDSGYFIDKHQFGHLIVVYSAAFSLYFYILKKTNSLEDISFWIKIGFILRGVLLFSLPHFSEDIYRFIWDGRLIHLGVNPFNFKPSYFFDNHLFTEYLTPDLYSQLNSPDYYTIYPSVCQGIFALSVWFFPKSIYGSAVLIKFFILCSEIGNILLLKKMLPHSKRLLVYVLNPLIIIELCGNAHFEAIMVFFFLFSLYILKKATHYNLFKSGILYALSIATKMLPFMFLPFFIQKVGIKKSSIFFISVGFSLVFLFLPLFNPVFIQNMQSSLSLYFQKFEFNSSLYYILRAIGVRIYGFNPILWISPLLTGFVGMSFLVLFFKKGVPQWDNTEGVVRVDWNILLAAISIYFLCATTVHPWYAALPLVISLFTRFNFVIVWTSVLPLTYIHYSYTPYQENYYLIALEYIVVLGYGLYEYFIPKKLVFNRT